MPRRVLRPAVGTTSSVQRAMQRTVWFDGPTTMPVSTTPDALTAATVAASWRGDREKKGVKHMSEHKLLKCANCGGKVRVDPSRRAQGLYCPVCGTRGLREVSTGRVAEDPAGDDEGDDSEDIDDLENDADQNDPDDDASADDEDDAEDDEGDEEEETEEYEERPRGRQHGGARRFSRT